MNKSYRRPRALDALVLANTTIMKLLLVLLLSTLVVASAARAGGRPKLRNFASPAEAQASAKQLQQTVSLPASSGASRRCPRGGRRRRRLAAATSART